MKERRRWLCRFLSMKDSRFSKIVLVGQRFRPKQTAGRPLGKWEDDEWKDFRESETSREGVKREVLNKVAWRRSMVSCVGIRRCGLAVSC